MNTPSSPLRELHDWVAANRPDLGRRLDPLKLGECVDVLNAETGLKISKDDCIETTAPLFLEALKSIHNERKS